MSTSQLVTSVALRCFEERYGRAPTHIVRAPGRVNLIGEHVDYHDLPVLPFAIDRAVCVAFAASATGGSESRIRIATGNGDHPARVVEGAVPGEGAGFGPPPDNTFESDDFELGPDPQKLPVGDWRNYVRAAALSLAAEQGITRGIDAWVASDLPVAAGLSSSSALVVAVGLALGRANEILVGRRAFAAQMARAERFTGTEGGGMDQAAALLSEQGHLSLIDFAPLRVAHLPFPRNLRVLLVNSGQVAEKSGAIQAEYNERRETGVRALAQVSRAMGQVGATFSELLMAKPPGDILSAAADHLDAKALSRFRHVVTEWSRVRSARQALESDDHTGLGHLLFESHASLRDDYAVSTPALDGLVEAARDAGALGARLTGAGFGGSVVVLATEGSEPRLRAALVAAAGSENSVMAVRPSGGAEIMEL